MPALSAPLLAALKASIEDEAAAWSATAVMTTPHVEQVISGDPPEASMVTKTSKTYQLTSAPLGTTLIAMAELDDADVMESMLVLYRGTGWSSTDEDLFDLLEDLAAACLATRESELLDLLA